MSGLARANGWHGFDDIGEKVERGQFGAPPARGGWLYRCDGMPSQMGCGEELVVTRRLTRVGVKAGSGWLVCYGEGDKPGTVDRDVVLTFCPSCRAHVEAFEAARGVVGATAGGTNHADQ